MYGGVVSPYQIVRAPIKPAAHRKASALQVRMGTMAALISIRAMEPAKDSGYCGVLYGSL
jgi:hypothetical protein